MMYFKKLLKVLTVALVVCVMLFSVINASAAFDPPIYTFLPIPSLLVPTVAPQFTFFTFLPLFTPAPSDTSSIVSFTDTHLRDALVAELGVGPSDLTENYLESLTGTLDLSGYGIERLGGIEYLTNLDYLILRNNPISSVHEVKKLKLLTGLESLDISALSITELPGELGSMSNLKYLDVSANRVDELPSGFSNFNLNVLMCNYCYFDISDSDFMNILISATTAADYQYQLQKIDFYAICQTAGTVTLKWDEMPDIYFPNGALAEVQRYSICEPNPSGSQGAWYKGLSRSTTSYTFEGLDPSKTYSFDISADYYIKNTVYYDSAQPKYIKFYSKELFQPIPQDTPTPAPTDTPTPSPTPVATDTPAPTVDPATSAPVDMVTVNPNATSATEQSGSSNSMLTTLLVVLIVLIAAIVGLVIFMFVKMNRPSGPDIQAPPR